MPNMKDFPIKYLKFCLHHEIVPFKVVVGSFILKKKPSRIGTYFLKTFHFMSFSKIYPIFDFIDTKSVSNIHFKVNAFKIISILIRNIFEIFQIELFFKSGKVMSVIKYFSQVQLVCCAVRFFVLF